MSPFNGWYVSEQSYTDIDRKSRREYVIVAKLLKFSFPQDFIKVC